MRGVLKGKILRCTKVPQPASMSWHKKGFRVSKHDNKLGNKGQIGVETCKI